ncbi:unnamed protein product [Peronospora belbahrii]|uniref:Uncharacterized protein n=1 Tax=Peronospora belbahrii TaxID=622444 RepID=A0ABN8CNY7_9STRA|nr:unnamed protein product [Peronospora belbahrii]
METTAVKSCDRSSLTLPIHLLFQSCQRRERSEFLFDIGSAQVSGQLGDKASRGAKATNKADDAIKSGTTSLMGKKDTQIDIAARYTADYLERAGELGGTSKQTCVKSFKRATSSTKKDDEKATSSIKWTMKRPQRRLDNGLLK